MCVPLQLKLCAVCISCTSSVNFAVLGVLEKGKFIDLGKSCQFYFLKSFTEDILCKVEQLC